MSSTACRGALAIIQPDLDGGRQPKLVVQTRKLDLSLTVVIFKKQFHPQYGILWF